MTRLEILPLCGNPSDERVSLRVRHQITMRRFSQLSLATEVPSMPVSATE